MKNKGVLIVVVFGLAFLAIMYTSSQGLSSYRVEVCMEYEGRSACRTASGSAKEHALRTATDNACAQLTSGVTGVIGCGNTVPKSVRWLDGK